MRVGILPSCILLVFCLSAMPVLAQTVDSAKIAEVRKHIDISNAKWCESHRTADAELLASLFVDDGALLMGKGRVLQGPSEIEKFFTTVYKKNGPDSMTITTLEVWVMDSIAYEYGRFTMKPLAPADGDTATYKGMYFEIWKQVPDGHWKILRDAGINPNKQP